jgi:hypothetical protein
VWGNKVVVGTAEGVLFIYEVKANSEEDAGTFYTIIITSYKDS